MPLSSGIETTQFKKVSALSRRKFRRSPWQQYSVMTSTGPEEEINNNEFQNTQNYTVTPHVKVQGKVLLRLAKLSAVLNLLNLLAVFHTVNHRPPLFILTTF